MIRQVNGPDKDWLTLDETAAALGVSSSTLERLIKGGRFPKGAAVSDANKAWNWQDVTSYLHLAGRFGADWSPPSAVKPAKGGKDDEES